MGWDYKSPKTFPALFSRSLQQAVELSPSKVGIFSTTSEAAAKSFMSNFRHYRWCIRQDPGHDALLGRIELGYQIRTRLKESLNFYTVELEAKPTRLFDLFESNPWLVTDPEIASQYQKTPPDAREII